LFGDRGGGRVVAFLERLRLFEYNRGRSAENRFCLAGGEYKSSSRRRSSLPLGNCLLLWRRRDKVDSTPGREIPKLRNGEFSEFRGQKPERFEDKLKGRKDGGTCCACQASRGRKRDSSWRWTRRYLSCFPKLKGGGGHPILGIDDRRELWFSGCQGVGPRSGELSWLVGGHRSRSADYQVKSGFSSR